MDYFGHASSFISSPGRIIQNHLYACGWQIARRDTGCGTILIIIRI